LSPHTPNGVDKHASPVDRAMTPEGTLVTITRAQALAAGYDDNDVAAAIRDGRWTRVRRGTYAVASSGGSPLSLEERHVQRARAIGARLRTGFALSHQSALLVHAIPVWGASLENVLVTRPATTSRTRAGVTFHRADLERHESVLVATLPVTSLSRSLVDLAAETGGTLALTIATHYGIPVSTTHTIAGAIMGAGATYRFSAVRWGIAERILWAWIITIPAAATVGGVCYWIISSIAGP